MNLESQPDKVLRKIHVPAVPLSIEQLNQLREGAAEEIKEAFVRLTALYSDEEVFSIDQSRKKKRLPERVESSTNFIIALWNASPIFQECLSHIEVKQKHLGHTEAQVKFAPRRFLPLGLGNLFFLSAGAHPPPVKIMGEVYDHPQYGPGFYYRKIDHPAIKPQEVTGELLSTLINSTNGEEKGLINFMGNLTEEKIVSTFLKVLEPQTT